MFTVEGLGVTGVKLTRWKSLASGFKVGDGLKGFGLRFAPGLQTIATDKVTAGCVESLFKSVRGLTKSLFERGLSEALCLQLGSLSVSQQVRPRSEAQLLRSPETRNPTP